MIFLLKSSRLEVHMETDRDRQGHTNKETTRQIDKHTYKHTSRQTTMQSDKWTNRAWQQRNILGNGLKDFIEVALQVTVAKGNKVKTYRSTGQRGWTRENRTEGQEN